MRPTLSVLDLAPVAAGSDVPEALARSVELARHAETLGYNRYWVAEHHNMPGIASSAPAVLLAHVGTSTARIRLGSGGVMLPNHPPLVVAEQFGMLEALHPGRIDLGIGRAPGTDQVTAHALWRQAGALSADDFPQQLGELLAFFSGRWPENHPYGAITAVPGHGRSPAMWLLGSSTYSAQVAGLLGLPFSFAHHFSADSTLPALAAYRSSFRPSPVLDQPHAMLAVSVVVAPTEQRATFLSGSSELAFLQLREGRPGQLPTPEEAADFPYTHAQRLQKAERSASHVLGDPEQVREQLDQLVADTGADELMITTMVHSQQERLESYSLLAQAWGLGSPLPELAGTAAL